jgi:hypothetical protein
VGCEVCIKTIDICLLAPIGVLIERVSACVAELEILRQFGPNFEYVPILYGGAFRERTVKGCDKTHETGCQAPHRHMQFRMWMEKCGGSTLRSVLSSPSNQLEDLVNVAHLLISAVQKLSQHKISHSDLKCDNIMVFKSPDGRLAGAKLIDFGVAKCFKGSRKDALVGRPARPL